MQGNFLLPVLVFLPMLGAIACYLTGRRSKAARNAAVLAVCALELTGAIVGVVWTLQGRTAEFSWDGFCGLGIHFTLDGFRAVYVAIAALMWFMTQGLFAPAYFSHHYRNRNRYYLFTLLTLGASAGVFLSFDLYTTFIFFELMSFTSYVWVAHDETPGALRAAETYLAVAVIGGMVTLMGLFLLWRWTGTLQIAQLKTAFPRVPASQRYWGAGLISFGFAAKAGAFPLHIWLPKAHPVAPAPASALLSGMLTKTGVFGLLIVSVRLMTYDALWGNVLLILGVVTMFVGALLAMFSVDLKKTLACSSMSQIGFILVGAGMASLLGHHDGLAVHGALLHMVNHSLIKLVLFMAAGAVYMNLHKLNLNDIRGFGRKKPVLHFAFLMGYLGIIGMPLFNGFVSKSLIHESILEYVELLKESGACWLPYKVSELLFLFTGGMTAAYMTKLYIALFWEKNTPKTQKEYDEKRFMPLPAALALLLSGALLPILGVFAPRLMTGIATLMQSFMGSHGPAEAVHYFSGENLLGAAESLAIGAALYLLVIRPLLMRRTQDGTREYVDRWPKGLDLENALYRPLLTRVLPACFGGICRVLDRLGDWARKVIVTLFLFCARVMDDGIDTLVTGMTHTLFRRRGKKALVPVGNRVTYALGRLFDRVVNLLNHTLCRRHPITIRFVYVFAAGWSELSTSIKRMTWSVSFGLMLLCVGLCLALFYILH